MLAWVLETLMRDVERRRGRILVVEDHPDVRQMTTVALQAQGHAVTEAVDAAEALERLRTGRFDVVLSDYELPDETGATMLRDAARAGLLGGAAALIVTAHTQPEDASGFDVILKPVDLDRLMRQIQEILKSDGGRAPAPAPAEDGGGEAVDLALYVTSASAASLRARRSMERVLTGYAGCPIRYTVRDVADDPRQAEEDRIVFAPTLVKRHPGPRTWVLGDLGDAAIVVDLLQVCGVRPRP